MSMLTELPDLCIREVSRCLAKEALRGHSVSIAAVSKSVHRAYAEHFHDAVDPGCVAEMAERRLIHRSGIQVVRDALLGGAAYISSARPCCTLRSLRELRELCKSMGLPASGTKAQLGERLREHDAAMEDRARARVMAAERILADPSLSTEPSEWKSPVRNLARSACEARLRASSRTVTYAEAIAMGLPEDVLRQMMIPPATLDELGVREAILAVRGPGTVDVPDPAAELERLSGVLQATLTRTRRAERMHALLASEGMDEAMIDDARVDRVALSRYVAGRCGEAAVLRLASKASKVLKARSDRGGVASRCVAEALRRLGGGASEGDLEMAMPGTRHALVSYEQWGMPSCDDDVAHRIVRIAEDAVLRLREVESALFLDGDQRRIRPDETSLVSDYVTFANGDPTASAHAVRERRFYTEHLQLLSVGPGGYSRGQCNWSPRLISWIGRRGGLRTALNAPELPPTLHRQVRTSACFGEVSRLAVTEARLANLSMTDRDVHRHLLAVIKLVASDMPFAPDLFDVLPEQRRLLHGAVRNLLRPRLAGLLRRQGRTAFVRCIPPGDWVARHILMVAFDAHMAKVPGWLYKGDDDEGEWASPTGPPRWLEAFRPEESERLALLALAAMDAARAEAEARHVDSALVVPDAVAASLSCQDVNDARDAARGVVRALLEMDEEVAAASKRRRTNEGRMMGMVEERLGANQPPEVSAVLRMCAMGDLDDREVWFRVVAAVASSSGRLLPCGVYSASIRAPPNDEHHLCIMMDTVDMQCDPGLMGALAQRGYALDIQPLSSAVDAASTWVESDVSEVLARIKALLLLSPESNWLYCPFCPRVSSMFCLQGLCSHLRMVHRATI